MLPLLQLLDNITFAWGPGGDDDGGEGGGTGDPLMLAFDGTLFFFHGEPSSSYNLLSESGSYQVRNILHGRTLRG